MIRTARSESKDSISVNWWRFSGTNLEDGWQAAFDLASNAHTYRWYVGVTDKPLGRMEGDPSNPDMIPHKRRGYHCLQPLIVTRNAGELEKLWTKRLTDQLGYARRGNKGNGGEHVRAGAEKFVYVCIRWQKS